MKKKKIILEGIVPLKRNSLIYLREDVEVEGANRKLYNGKIFRVPREKLIRAYHLIQSITDQHLRSTNIYRPQRFAINENRGISQHFKYLNGVDVYVYAPESLEDIRHIKINYDAVLPMLQIIYALDLPSHFDNKKE